MWVSAFSLRTLNLFKLGDMVKGKWGSGPKRGFWENRPDQGDDGRDREAGPGTVGFTREWQVLEGGRAVPTPYLEGVSAFHDPG